MLAPRGAQRQLHVRKPHSRAPLGPPFGRSFLVLLVTFCFFFFMIFLRVVLEGFSDSFGVDFGTIFEEILCVGRCNFGCGASLAKCHLDSLFTILEACRRFRKQWNKMQNLQHLRPISARSGRRGFWKHFGSILGRFSEASGSQNRRKCDPKTTSKKSRKKTMRGCAR